LGESLDDTLHQISKEGKTIPTVTLHRVIYQPPTGTEKVIDALENTAQFVTSSTAINAGILYLSL